MYKYCRPIILYNLAYNSKEDALKTGNKLMQQLKDLYSKSSKKNSCCINLLKV